MTIVTRSRDETVAFGRRLGRLLGPGHVVALTGPLGSGKTTLTKGLAEGLGVSDSRMVTSPTFVLVHEYQGRVAIHHVDLYRLGGPADAESLGLDELFFGDEVTIVEWAERIAPLLPDERLDVAMGLAGEQERRLTLAPRGEAYERIVRELGRDSHSAGDVP